MQRGPLQHDHRAYPPPPAKLPRSGLALWLAVYVVVGLVLWGLPVPVIAFGMRGGSTDVSKFGTLAMFVEFPTHAIAMLLVGILGGLYVVGRRISGALLFIVALGPFFAGIAIAAIHHRSVLRNVPSSWMTPPAMVRGFVERIAAERSPIVLGSVMTAFTLTLVALAALLRVASLDRRAIDPGRTRKAGAAMGIAGGVAVLALAGGFALRAVFREFHALPGLLILGATLAAAILAASRAPLAQIVDEPKPGLPTGDVVPTLLVLAVSMAAAALFLGSAGGSLGLAMSLQAITAESADPSQQTRILLEGISAMEKCPIIGIVDALFVFGALLVPVLLSGAARRGFAWRISALVWGFGSLAAIGASAAYGHTFWRALDRVQPGRNFGDVAGLSLPIAQRALADADGRPALYVTREGRLSIDVSGGLEPPVPANDRELQQAWERESDSAVKLLIAHESPALVCDAQTTYGTFLRAMAPVFARAKTSASFRGYALVLAPPPGKRVAQELPAPWRGLVRDTYSAIEVRFEFIFPSDLTLVLEEATARVRGSKDARDVFPTGKTEADKELRRAVLERLLASDRGGIWLSFRARKTRSRPS